MDHSKGLVLSEIADGVSVEDVKAATGCSFQVTSTSTILINKRANLFHPSTCICMLSSVTVYRFLIS